MAPTPLTERNRDRLLALLADDRPDAPSLSSRLREVGSQEGIEACSAALALLAPLQLPEAEAGRVLEAVSQHRREMSRALRRDPGLLVAAVDFLSGVERRLASPEIVERSLVAGRKGRACTDPITGLLDPRAFAAAVERELRRARRYRRTCALVVLELERLDQVRTSLGSLYADLVLERAGRIVRRSMRETDAGGRIGGASLAVVLPGAPRQGAARIGERIRARVEAELGSGSLRGHAPRVAVTGGIGCHPQDAHTCDTLFARARAALLLARERGGNRIVGHHSERRASPRLLPAHALSAQVEVGSGGRMSSALAVNVSRGGALLALQGAFHTADPIRVRLAGGSPEQGAAGFVSGRVVRIERGPGSSAPLAIGIEFDAPLAEELLRAAGGPS